MVQSNSLSDRAQDDGLGDPRLEKLWHKVPLHFSMTSETCPDMLGVKAWRMGLSTVTLQGPPPVPCMVTTVWGPSGGRWFLGTELLFCGLFSLPQLSLGSLFRTFLLSLQSDSFWLTATRP